MNDFAAPAAAEEIYAREFQERLFDEMSATYERVNHWTSFGFSRRWRRQFLNRAELAPGAAVLDLMCGSGECWPWIARRIGNTGRIVGVDFSAGMLRGAERRRGEMPAAVEIRREDALATQLAAESFDAVTCCYGVKTLAPEQWRRLAEESWRVLRPGGAAALVEVSDPRGWPLRGLYLFYLRRIIPGLGWLLLGNPENYRMLGRYTERFGDCGPVAEAFAETGFHVRRETYFYGCATGLLARKPA